MLEFYILGDGMAARKHSKQLCAVCSNKTFLRLLGCICQTSPEWLKSSFSLMEIYQSNMLSSYIICLVSPLVQSRHF